MEKSSVLLSTLFMATAFGAPLIIKNDPPPTPEKEVVEEEVSEGKECRQKEREVV